jgi:hypothetical protein
MRSPIVFAFFTILALCAAAAGCTLITEVDRGLIGAGGEGGMGGTSP